MTNTKYVTERESLYMRLLYREQKLSVPLIQKQFPQYSRATIYRHVKRTLDEKTDRRSGNSGRPPKVTEQDRRQIVRKVPRLREQLGTFTVKRLRLEAGVSHVSTHTVRRVLHKAGYKYLQSRKKGLLTSKDLKQRAKFARQSLRRDVDFWRQEIGMFIDATSFVFKTNPHDQARAPRARNWRKRSEGLDQHCTSKGRKSGNGGKSAAFMVGISYDSGVVLCEQYQGRLNGVKIAKMITDTFPQALAKCANHSTLILQDNDPVQTSKAAQKAFQTVGAELFPIPARSPDINVIENCFKVLAARLREEALCRQIVKESYEQFSDRVKTAITNLSPAYINKTIESLNKRMVQVVKRKGQRIRY